MGSPAAQSTPRQTSAPHGAPASGTPGGGDLAPLPALLRAASGGDERAWRAIVDLYARRVYALARSRLRGPGGSAGGRGRSGGGSPWPEGNDAAEEVTQSVFCTLAAKLSAGEYTEQGRFESWLFRVAMNRIRDEVRRRRRQAEPTSPEALDEAVVDGGPGAAGVAGGHGAGRASADELGALRAALASLDDDDREVVELRHHAGMSFKSIAEMLEEPIGTLLARHHRALRKLKEILGTGGEGMAGA